MARLTTLPPQRGFSLITTLILLIIVTLLGVAASQLVLMSERGARYDRDYKMAYQAAEAALKDAEFDLAGPNTHANQRMNYFAAKRNAGAVGWVVSQCGTSGKLRGLCKAADKELNQPDVWLASWFDFTNSGSDAPSAQFGEFTGRAFPSGDSGVRPAQLPRYIIEEVDDNQAPGGATDRILYRVTAIGFGPKVHTQVVLQMIYRKPGVAL